MNRYRPIEDRPLRNAKTPAHVWIGACANAFFGAAFGALVGFLIARYFWGTDPWWDEWAIIAIFAIACAAIVVRNGQDFCLNLRDWW